jgi:hypothetical protein
MSCGLYYSLLGGLQIFSLLGLTIYEHCYWGSEGTKNGRDSKTLVPFYDCVNTSGDGQHTNDESEDH